MWLWTDDPAPRRRIRDWESLPPRPMTWKERLFLLLAMGICLLPVLARVVARLLEGHR